MPSSPPLHVPWGALIPDDQLAILNAGRAAAEQAGVRFVLGGALALATYTGRWRNTKDIDFVVHPDDHRRLIGALRRAGFEDYYEQLPYDRSWIFRGFREGVILDIIWDLPNHRVNVDEAWFSRAQPILIRDLTFHAMPLEELIRAKLYVLQRERCDWVDVINALAGSTVVVDWEFLIRRMGRDVSLLHAMLVLFNWLCPGRAAELPAYARTRFGLPVIETNDPAAMEARRVRLFDSRPWFAPLEPDDRPLER
ncbi:MAG TPA: nucleotidyl transferase AbiEii/AbiGii toxin family protein [Candidatus Synoicihabitans sp.]|nr:nucleotidyl transferase AbiEii/AbiGii toxin family protein [Candidatus Synoicihabitans sp.]